MSIRVENLTHIYSPDSPYERAAINDISFNVDDGEFIGIIGHTGSGKSTLIQHLNGLLKAQKGHIFVDDTDITSPKCNLKEIRAKVGLVFQYPEYQLFEETVYADIAFGPKNLNLSKEEVDQRVFEAIEFVGLDPQILTSSPFELSGGQKRRVAIAGVLAMRPKFLVLDEPTAGLDPAARNDLLFRLKELHNKTNNTILLVSHSMEDIANTVDKVMVLSKGSLVLFDTVKNVFSNSEMLKEIGLDIPQICEVVLKLRKTGIDINSYFNVEETADALCKLIKGVKNA